MENRTNDVTGREIAGHAIAGIGQNLVYGLWGSFVMIFYTDVFGISALAAGMIMMFTRVWDAVNDPMMGAIADKTRTKWGRYKPWVMFMSVPVGILLVLSFCTPNLPPTGKIIYGAVTYVLMSMAFTAVDIPYWSLPSAMTSDGAKRSKIFSTSRVSTTLTSLIAGVVIVPVTELVGKGNQQKGFLAVAIIFAVASSLFYIFGIRNVQEHVAPVKQEKTGAKEAIKVITQNKPLLLIIASVLFILTTNSLRSSVMPYYAQYNMGSRALVSIMTLCNIPGMLCGMLIAPILAKKLGKKRTYLLACVYGAVTNIIFFVLGYTNLTLVFLCIGFTAASYGCIVVLESSMIADTIEYAQLKTGQRRAALVSSTQTFASKVCSSISGGLIGVILTVSGYVANQPQSETVLSSFHMMMTLLIAAAYIVAMIPMKFNPMTEEMHAKIVAELEEKQMA